MPICFRLPIQVVRRAFSRAAASAGNSMAARTAMMAMTTSSSISVNAATFLREDDFIALSSKNILCA